MAIKHRHLIKKEILPCHCMRYVYAQDVDVLYCKYHTRLIERKPGRVEMRNLLHKLYTAPAFVPKAKKEHKNWFANTVLVFFCLIFIAVCGYAIMPVFENEKITWPIPSNKYEKEPIWDILNERVVDHQSKDPLVLPDSFTKSSKISY